MSALPVIFLCSLLIAIPHAQCAEEPLKQPARVASPLYGQWKSYNEGSDIVLKIGRTRTFSLVGRAGNMNYRLHGTVRTQALGEGWSRGMGLTMPEHLKGGEITFFLSTGKTDCSWLLSNSGHLIIELAPVGRTGGASAIPLVLFLKRDRLP